MICAKNSTACSGTGTIGFTLDALDRLLSRVGTTTTAFTWSGLTEDPAKTADGTTTAYYAYTRSGAPLGQKVTTGKTTTLGFYLSDPHGDIVGTASAGAVGGSRSYDPWGKPLATSGSTSYLGYQGDPTDPSTGQVDMGTRSYEPTLGRFSTRDVLFGDPTSPMSLNQFVYATDSPITITDPTGMCGCKKGNDAWRGSPQPDESTGDVSVETPTASWPDPPVAQVFIDVRAQFMAYQQFGPVVSLVPTAVRAANAFDVDPRLLVGILLIEGAGRQYYAQAAKDMEKLQVLLGDPDPSIGVMQMKLAVFEETTQRHVETFGLPLGASSDAGWRSAFLARLQNDRTAIRYSAAHVQDLIAAMRPSDRTDLPLVAATYNAGIDRYADTYVPYGAFNSGADTYRSAFASNLPWIIDILS